MKLIRSNMVKLADIKKVTKFIINRFVLLIVRAPLDQDPYNLEEHILYRAYCSTINGSNLRYSKLPTFRLVLKPDSRKAIYIHSVNAMVKQIRSLLVFEFLSTRNKYQLIFSGHSTICKAR